MTGFLIQLMSGSGFCVTRPMYINCVARFSFLLKYMDGVKNGTFLTEVNNIGPDSQRVQTSSDFCGDALSYHS